VKRNPRGAAKPAAKRKNMYKIATESEQEAAAGKQVTTSATSTDLNPLVITDKDVTATVAYITETLFAQATDAEKESVISAMATLGHSDISKLDDNQKVIFAKNVLELIPRFNDITLAGYYEKFAQMTGDVKAAVEAKRRIARLKRALPAVESKKPAAKRNSRKMYKIATESEQANIEGTQVITSATATDMVPEPMSNADVTKTIDYIIDNLFANATDSERETVAAEMTKIAIDINSKSLTGQQRALFAKAILDNIVRLNDVTLAAYYPVITSLGETGEIAVESRANGLTLLVTARKGAKGSRGSKARRGQYAIATESENRRALKGAASGKRSPKRKHPLYQIATESTRGARGLRNKKKYAIATESENRRALKGLVTGSNKKNNKAKYKIATEAENAVALITSNVSPDTNATPVTRELYDAQIEKIISETYTLATDAEQIVIANDLADANIDPDDVTNKQAAQFALSILTNVANAMKPELTPFVKLMQIEIDNGELTDEDFATVNSNEVPSITAAESVAALTKKYNAIAAKPNSEFAGVFALENIPNAYVGLFKGLSTPAKRVLAAKAKNVTTAAENIKFWANTNFIGIEKSVIATENAIFSGKSDAEIAVENDAKVRINFLSSAHIKNK
jgi:uncharacterized protein YwgA